MVLVAAVAALACGCDRDGGGSGSTIKWRWRLGAKATQAECWAYPHCQSLVGAPQASLCLFSTHATPRTSELRSLLLPESRASTSQRTNTAIADLLDFNMPMSLLTSSIFKANMLGAAALQRRMPELPELHVTLEGKHLHTVQGTSVAASAILAVALGVSFCLRARGGDIRPA